MFGPIMLWGFADCSCQGVSWCLSYLGAVTSFVTGTCGADCWVATGAAPAGVELILGLRVGEAD